MNILEKRIRKKRLPNLVPLINIVFLLLIFFMLSGTLSKKDLFEVEPPSSYTASNAESPEIIILISYDNKISIDDKIISSNELEAYLSSLLNKESIEEAVAREVFEEVGLTVNSPIYCYSQPWPFPRSLMLGFKAEATSDQIIIDDNELENALWLTKQEIINSPENETFKLPGKLSIARRLINDWLG